MTKFKVGDKVEFSGMGLLYLEEEKYKPNLINDHYTIRQVEKNEVDGDYYLLNTSFETIDGWATGFLEEELEVTK